MPAILCEFYLLISDAIKDIPSRQQARLLRQAGLKTHAPQQGLIKVAFDTRRIDQETEYNPRRGLQNYHRSQAFLSEAMATKIKNFAKIRGVLEELKQQFGKEHEWQDSNARVLLSTLNNGLRIQQQDGDFSDSQPVQGSLDYIEELLQVRYRLNLDNLTKMGAPELKEIILSRDEELTHKDVKQALEITRHDIAKQGYDTLMDKLFTNCHATAENPDIERTITITIRDRFRKED